MYSSGHQIVCDSDLRIAHYSSRWRLMITSECPTIGTPGCKLFKADRLERNITLIPNASRQRSTRAKSLWRCFVQRRSFLKVAGIVTVTVAGGGGLLAPGQRGLSFW